MSVPVVVPQAASGEVMLLTLEPPEALALAGDLIGAALSGASTGARLEALAVVLRLVAEELEKTRAPARAPTVH